MFFALLAFDAIDRFLRKPAFGADVTFGAACALGFLSHVTFLHAYAGIFVWSLVRDRRPAVIARLHAFPIVFFAWLYGSFIRHLTIGGSPPRNAFDALVESIGKLFASGDNRIAIIIPCHRVVRNDGTLCGYGSGLWRKQFLLNLEGTTGVALKRPDRALAI